MRHVLTTLIPSEWKLIKDAAEKFKGDKNQNNYDNALREAMRQACKRINKVVGEVELTAKGEIVLRYEVIPDHELRVLILKELELIRSATDFQAQVLQNQLNQVFKANEKKQDTPEIGETQHSEQSPNV